jgi:hypothetical protein
MTQHHIPQERNPHRSQLTGTSAEHSTDHGLESRQRPTIMTSVLRALSR